MEVLIAAALGAAGLVVVLLALQRDAPVDLPQPEPPDWDPLPTRADLARADFPLRVPGYDPATVDLAFDALADAYADLLAEADPATIARARRRAEHRLRSAGRRIRDGGPVGGTALADMGDQPSWEGAGGNGRRAPRQDGDAAIREALRAEAALDALRREAGTA